MPSPTTPVATSGTLVQAPADLAGWLAAIEARELPVLRGTATALEQLRAIEDQVDAHGLVDELGQDPLFNLKLLRHVAWLRRDRASTDIETSTEALVMLGIGPFFRAFGPQPTAEALLEAHPGAEQGFDAVLQRAHRAANFALAFAVHRQDTDAGVIYLAALLHDFADLLLWLHAPTLAQAVSAYRQRHPECHSAQAQNAVLNITLAALQQSLMKVWHLPQLLIDISDDEPSERPQVRNVQLAIRVARHSAQGWHNSRLEEDLVEVARLLGLAHEPCLALLQNIDT